MQQTVYCWRKAASSSSLLNAVCQCLRTSSSFSRKLDGFRGFMYHRSCCNVFVFFVKLHFRCLVAVELNGVVVVCGGGSLGYVLSSSGELCPLPCKRRPFITILLLPDENMIGSTPTTDHSRVREGSGYGPLQAASTTAASRSADGTTP